MRKLLFSFLLTVSLAAGAEEIDSAFVSMPDSLFPYLSREQRGELLNMQRIDTSTHAVLSSVFQGKVEMCKLTTDRISLRLDSLSSMEMMRLRTAEKPVYCLLRTVSAPENHSDMTLYDEAWKETGRVDIDGVSLVQRPDTMSDKRFEDLCKLIEFQLVEAHFVDVETVELKLNVPMLSKEDRQQLDAILVRRKMKWNGKTFVCQ